MQYSKVLYTEYDQPTVIGTLGHGNHYSILSFPQWRGLLNEPERREVRNQRIGVIWDEDHDTRVIRVIERAYADRLMAPVLFVGECKAYLRVVVQDEFEFGGGYLTDWKLSLAQALTNDSWAVEIIHLKDVGSYGIVVADKEVVGRYLGGIIDLWGVGEVLPIC